MACCLLPCPDVLALNRRTAGAYWICNALQRGGRSDDGAGVKLSLSLRQRPNRLFQEEEVGKDTRQEENPAPGIAPPQSAAWNQEQEPQLKSFYEPKVGDVVVGEVVFGDGKVLDVEIGARWPAIMLVKDARPFDEFQLEDRMWDDPRRVPPRGEAFIMKNDEIVDALDKRQLVLDPGTVLQALVIGVTVSGRALLSLRSFARRNAWERVRQIFEIGGILRVRPVACTVDRLVCRIEGLTASLPVDQLQDRDVASMDYVGKHLKVRITVVDESKSRLVVSQRAAWEEELVPPDSLVDGIVESITHLGAVVKIDGKNISALLHNTKISYLDVQDAGRVFSVGERIRAVVLKSRYPHRLCLSTQCLERERGSILRDKERIFRGAEQTYRMWRSMKKYRERPDRFRVPYKEMLEREMEAERKRTANLHWLEFEDEEAEDR